MKSFFTLITSDYLQRTRSYTFLITLCASLAIAYTFVPEPNASYSTIRIADHVGYYNSAWFGYITAIMTSIFLSLIGFYLINSGIKNDIQTRVGHIIAATPLSNFKYLLSKVLSNFLVLASIVGAVFMMSLMLFFLYNDGYPFEPLQFLRPYLFITLPALFFIAVLGVVFEVFLGKYSIVQQLVYFFLFSFLMVFTPKTEAQFSLDVFGSKIVMHKLEETVRAIANIDGEADLSIGYVLGNVTKTERFVFDGVDFPLLFLGSRLLIVVLGILIIGAIAPLFHRFNTKVRVAQKKPPSIAIIPKEVRAIDVSQMAVAKVNYGIGSLLKTEFLLLLRAGKKWLWFVNIGGMVLLVILPLSVAHQMVLPILWFLQVHRLSSIGSKERTHNVHYFAFTAYKPLRRVFASQLTAGSMLIIGVTVPLLIRHIFLADYTSVIAILLGGLLIVFVAALLGILSKGKKLFEVLFFMITYANVNGIPSVDYFGGFEHGVYYMIRLTILLCVLGVATLLCRKYQLTH